MSATLTNCLAEFFKARPNVWIDGKSLEFAGRYAWRSRVSDLRRSPHFMRIVNRQRGERRPDGSRYVVSEYVFVEQDVGKQDATTERVNAPSLQV